MLLLVYLAGCYCFVLFVVVLFVCFGGHVHDQDVPKELQSADYHSFSITSVYHDFVIETSLLRHFYLTKNSTSNQARVMFSHSISATHLTQPTTGHVYMTVRGRRKNQAISLKAKANRSARE